MEKLAADASVQPDAARHILHIAADLLADVRHLVDEGDLGGQEGIGGIFDQLAGFAAGEHDRGLVEIERPVDFTHHRAGLLGIAAHHHPVRTAKILQRRAFAQKLRIGSHVELGIGTLLADDLLDLAAGAHRHG